MGLFTERDEEMNNVAQPNDLRAIFNEADRVPMKVFRMNGAKLPTKKDEDVGWDLYCSEYIFIPVGKIMPVRIGIKTAIERGYAAIIKEKSGLAKDGVEVHGGVIDSGYRGEWLVLVKNNTESPLCFYQGQKVAQFILIKNESAIMVAVDEEEQLGDSVRGVNGFGSTGR
jgi:dUTP pyrophosphatase